MVERGAFVVVVAVCLGMGAALGACSPAAESAFADAPEEQKSSEPEPMSPLVPAKDADAGVIDAGPVSCSPNVPETFKPVWNAPSAKGDCSDAELEGYWTACLANAGDKDGCAAWTEAHAKCTSCIEPVDGSGPIQWHQSRLFYTMNVAGCIALTQGDVSADGCGATYNAAVQCNRASCDTCFAKGGDFATFRACQTDSQKVGVCKSYETVQGNACQGVTSQGAPTLACFRGTGEAAAAHFARVEKIFCGAAAE